MEQGPPARPEHAGSRDASERVMEKKNEEQERIDVKKPYKLHRLTGSQGLYFAASVICFIISCMANYEGFIPLVCGAVLLQNKMKRK